MQDDDPCNDDDNVIHEPIDLDVCNVDEPMPFEDHPMPVLTCLIEEERLQMSPTAKILIDTGSKIDLMSSKFADQLRRQGLPVVESPTHYRIRCANGSKSTITLFTCTSKWWMSRAA